ncbi:hypothetical protein F0562_036058 [Nyssa sinensis]|uniref:FHA domain-containing protein n=1 Tax=Nyssa sinensis TaxID=561372 RepID=A0A5J5ACK5_9ASTE|nr:hypothetical protein F0562_036058 [Nyssa sinensis]
MGALAPVSFWIPEDDLLLKNSVEAGASLESLAKGAVQFSRRFTVQELQNRWHSLLYDPDVSAEASVRMIEFESSTSFLPSKPNRFANSKENKCVSGKRKAESVRKCYYAMRKRICSQPFDPMDLSFLVTPGNNNCIGNGDEPPSANCMLRDPVSNHFGVQDSSFDTMPHVFPQFAMGSAAGVGITSQAFYMGVQNPVENDIPFFQSNMNKQISCTFAEDLPLTESCGVEELSQPKELPVCDIFEADGLETKPSATFERSDGNLGNICSEFGGSQVFNSPISDCGASFHNLGYSSPLPQMPIWSAIEGISAPTMSDVHLCENKQHTGDTFSLLDDHDVKNIDTLGFDVTHSDSKLKNPMQCDNMENPTRCPDDYFAELSNTFLNFTNQEELLFMDDDGKDRIDKLSIEGLSSILLDSPNVDDVPNITGTEASVAAPDEYLCVSGVACPGELDDNERFHYGDVHTICSSEAQIFPCTSTVNPQFPELHGGVISCMLNTEDTEIPCNDDVFLPILMPPPSSSSLPSAIQSEFHEFNHPKSSFVKDFSNNQKTNAGGLSLIKSEGKNPEQPHLSSQTVGSHLLQEMSLNYPVDDHGDKFGLRNDDCPQVANLSASTVCGGPNQISSAIVNANHLLPVTLKNEATEIEQAKHLTYSTVDSYLEKPIHGFDGHVSYPQKNASFSKQEIDAQATIRNHQALHAELDSIEMTVPEPVINPSPSDQEELPFESDDDVPYFSDVEAMILDMDLSPDDQDLYSSREVSRYQHENSKRVIIRLEQSVHSYMQRVIASQGALAVLYGHHSKHYIKKPEVLLGRATEDVKVDIDLGREGCANKISRRQAIIKMDEGGSFYLKNLGKSSIFVNNKEVTCKQSLTLTSNCFIEIRGIPFVFETNQTCVKRYVDNVTKDS